MPPCAATVCERVGKTYAHVLELDHHLGGATAHVFDRVLVAQVVGALDGIVHVPVPVVLGRVAERRGDAALRCDSVRARRKDLAQHRDPQPGARELERGAQARAPGAHDDRIESSDLQPHAHLQRICTVQPR